MLYKVEAELPEQSVTSAKLSPALSDLIDGNGSLEQALPAGTVIARKPGEAPPPGYRSFNAMNTTPFSSGKRATLSVGRYAYDGIELVDDKIYFVGGNNGTDLSIVERYDPATDQWVTISSLVWLSTE